MHKIRAIYVFFVAYNFSENKTIYRRCNTLYYTVFWKRKPEELKGMVIDEKEIESEEGHNDFWQQLYELEQLSDFSSYYKAMIEQQ